MTDLGAQLDQAHKISCWCFLLVASSFFVSDGVFYCLIMIVKTVYFTDMHVHRRVWPQYVQKHLYMFLKYNFDYWPLDSMFRMVCFARYIAYYQFAIISVSVFVKYTLTL